MGRLFEDDVLCAAPEGWVADQKLIDQPEHYPGLTSLVQPEFSALLDINEGINTSMCVYIYICVYK